MSTSGIHHITAISSNVQKTYDFYTDILGLRLVKKTVNFDAPEVYHLYFGNESGEPGTALTFFPFPDAGTGMRGLGQVTKIYFAVPISSISFWLERFVTKSVKHELLKNRFGEKYITFYDPDGLQLEIVGTKDELKIPAWKDSHIPPEHGIHGFHGAELAVESKESIENLLKVLGYKFQQQDELLVRYINEKADSAKYLDLLLMKGWPEGISSAGTNHHIAFRVPSVEAQIKLRKEIQGAGFSPTELVERFYFSSIYFREKNGILFEIATDTPGFDIDEPISELGSSLKLPKQYEPQRKYIESLLPNLNTDNSKYSNELEDDGDLDLFRHRFVDNGSDSTYVLFHGTGGDELDMIKFANAIKLKSNFLSIRGNVPENGMNRFFERYSDGTFNVENIKEESAKFAKFLEAAKTKYHLDNQTLSFLGYSNGANFALAISFLYKMNIKNLVALHPKVPLGESSIDLSGIKFIITYGEFDEYTSEEDISSLKKIVKQNAGSLEIKKFNGGHSISPEELEFLFSLE